MLALAVMPVVFVLGEKISLGIYKKYITASEMAKSLRYVKIALKVPQ